MRQQNVGQSGPSGYIKAILVTNQKAFSTNNRLHATEIKIFAQLRADICIVVVMETSRF